MKARQTDSNARGTSRYATKVRNNRQMYGNGKRCCAHHHCPAIIASYADGNKEVFTELTD